MKKLMTGTLALGLLFAAASCGSDEKKDSDSTVATEVSTAESVLAGADETIVGDSVVVDDSAVEVPAGDLTPTQALVLAQVSGDIVTAGGVPDVECFTAVVAQLSEEDAQLIVDAGPGGSPTLSAAGEALLPEVNACAEASGVTAAS